MSSQAEAAVRRGPIGGGRRPAASRRSSRTVYPLSIGFVAGVAASILVIAIVSVVGRPDNGQAPTLRHDFTHSAPGAPDRADSGQLWSSSSNGTPGATLKVADGRLTSNALTDAPAAGYVSVDLGQSVTLMTATYEFRPGSTGGGAVGLLVRSDLAPPVPMGQLRFTSPAHLAVGRERMEFGVANDGKITVIGAERFDQPLEFGKLYSTRMELDYQNGVARVEGPDGRAYVFSDPRIRINRGNVACFEVYQQLSETDDRAAFSSVAAA